MQRPKLISVIGPNEKTCTAEIYDFGLELGKALMDQGYFMVCGGMQGLMEAVCKGARNSNQYKPGCTIGIIPSLDKSQANPYCDIVIPTGIGIARNQLVVNTGDAVVAVGGGAGTLSEIAFSWQFKKPIICYVGFGGWSEKLAGVDLDNTASELIKKAESLGEVMAFLNEALKG